MVVYAAIDPMAMIFSASAYQRLIDLWHPDDPKVADLVAVLKSMPPEEQRATVGRAKTLVAYGKAVQQAAAEVAG